MILILPLTVASLLPEQCFSSLIQNQSCDWYVVCLESAYNCGPQGYPLGYGFKYCTKFGQLKDKVVTAARNWIQLTTICLKLKLSKDLVRESRNCKSLKQDAFASHPLCYKQSGFCKLYEELGPIQSQKFIKQLLGVFQAKDFQSFQAIQQILKLEQQCLGLHLT